MPSSRCTTRPTEVLALVSVMPTKRPPCASARPISARQLSRSPSSTLSGRRSARAAGRRTSPSVCCGDRLDRPIVGGCSASAMWTPRQRLACCAPWAAVIRLALWPCAPPNRYRTGFDEVWTLPSANSVPNRRSGAFDGISCCGRFSPVGRRRSTANEARAAAGRTGLGAGHGGFWVAGAGELFKSPMRSCSSSSPSAGRAC